METSIKERRMTALHNYVSCSTDSRRKEVLTLLVAIISDKQIKIVVEELGIKY